MHLKAGSLLVLTPSLFGWAPAKRQTALPLRRSKNLPTYTTTENETFALLKSLTGWA